MDIDWEDELAAAAGRGDDTNKRQRSTGGLSDSDGEDEVLSLSVMWRDDETLNVITNPLTSQLLFYHLV